MADYNAQYGTFNSNDAYTDENAEDIDATIHRLIRGQFPILARIATRNTNNYQFDVRKSNVRAWEYTCASADDTTTGLTFTIVTDSKFGVAGAITSAYLKPETLLMNRETLEIVRILTGAVSGSAVVVTREVGEVGEQTITVSDTFMVIGSTAVEGADIGTIALPAMDRKTNYTQIFRTAWGLTKTAKASRQHYPDELARQRFDMMYEHMEKMELSVVFGQQKNDTSNNWRESRGLLRWITDSDTLANNSTDVAGVLTESGLNTALLTWATQSNRRGRSMVLFCAPRVKQQITGFAADRIQTTNPATGVYGYSITRLITDWGEIEIVECPLWGMYGADLDGTYHLPHGMAILLDMSDIAKRPLVGGGENRNTHKIAYEFAGGTADAFKEELLTEVGWELVHPALHHLFFGIDAS